MLEDKEKDGLPSGPFCSVLLAISLRLATTAALNIPCHYRWIHYPRASSGERYISVASWAAIFTYCLVTVISSCPSKYWRE